MNASPKGAVHPCMCPLPDHHAPTVSRRTMLAGITATPMFGPSTVPLVPDPVLPLCQKWQAGMEQADTLRSEWSRLEQACYQWRGAKSFDEAITVGTSEAIDLLEVEKHQRELDHNLDRLIRKIIAQPSETHLGIAAKLALALELADPVERADPSWQLVQGALDDLKAAE